MLKHRPIGLALVVSCVLLTACATGSNPHSLPHTQNLTLDDEVGRCARLFDEIDALVEKHGLGDAETVRVSGFPYLRVNRFLASLRDSLNDQTRNLWIDQLAELGAEGRRHELAKMELDRVLSVGGSEGQLDECAETLRAHDFALDANIERLQSTAVVGSSYRPLNRVLGLYPLTSLGFQWGIGRLHDKRQRDFDVPLDELPVEGRLVRYALNAPAAGRPQTAIAAILARARDNALEVPLPTDEELQLLFEYFAPVFEIDTIDSNDRIGWVRFDEAHHPMIDTDRARVYTLASHAYVGGVPHLQLNYTVWFKSRPRRGWFDLLGGDFDGITWRVTVDDEANVLLADAIHNCGCYHLVIPGQYLRLVRASSGYEEALFVPQKMPVGSTQPTVRISSAAHYIQRVHLSATQHPVVGYELNSYDELRSLAATDGSRHSFFAPDGIVEGSQRPERWLFWPMGVHEPGAMRQWGTHAIAFVGQRHFDDPQWIDTYFERVR